MKSEFYDMCVYIVNLTSFVWHQACICMITLRLEIWQDRYADDTFQELDSGYVISDESIVESIDKDISMDILRSV